jgi:3-phenylpropionate/trans-cinnamate dioxygenase ferredoxin reductase subunit
VESVNAPLDHMAARKLLETGRNVAPEIACDSSLPLKAHLLIGNGQQEKR